MYFQHLIQFIEDKKEKLSPNHILFLKIISKNLDLQMEAVNDIKDNYKVFKNELSVLQDFLTIIFLITFYRNEI